MKEKVKYIKHCVFHPFDGFYEAKNRGKGSMVLTAILIAVFCLVECLRRQYTGFILNTVNIAKINTVTIFISYLSVILIAGVSNWTVTTLFEGKGKLKDIYLVIAYSLVPTIIARLLVIFVSNFVIEEEVPILQVIVYFGWVWTAFLIVTGLCTIHEYGLAKNLVTLLATVVAAAIILFLFVLFISLIEQMISFVRTFVKEWLRRING